MVNQVFQANHYVDDRNISPQHYRPQSTEKVEHKLTRLRVNLLRVKSSYMNLWRLDELMKLEKKGFAAFQLVDGYFSHAVFINRDLVFESMQCNF